MSAVASVFDAAREWLLGFEAERRAAAVPNDRRARAETWRGVALRRVRAAADLSEPAAAVVLLREAVTAFVLAERALSAADESVARRDEREVEAALGELLAAGGGQVWGDRVLSVLERRALGEMDDLPPAELEDARVALEQAAHWFSRRVDARSAPVIRRARRVRIAALVLFVVALAFGVIRWASSPLNVALGKPVRASSIQPGTPAGVALVDGRSSTSFAIHTRRERSPWVAIDLGQSRPIARIEVENRHDGRLDDVLPLNVELSTDGVRYTDLARRNTSFDVWSIEVRGRTARHVRFVSPRERGVIVLDEVRVFAAR